MQSDVNVSAMLLVGGIPIPPQGCLDEESAVTLSEQDHKGSKTVASYPEDHHDYLASLPDGLSDAV